MKRAGALAAIAVISTSYLVGCTVGPDSPDDMPDPPNLSADERTQLAQDDLDAQWDVVTSMFPAAERPDVEAERYITVAETAPVYAECLNEQGFDVVETGDGGISYENVPPDQEQQVLLARYVCAARFPLDPTYTTPLTDDEIDYLYNYQTGPLVECLEREGYTASEPSSLAKYRSDYKEGVPPWTPYEDVAAIGDDWVTLIAKCPEIPAGFRGN